MKIFVAYVRIFLKYRIRIIQYKISKHTVRYFGLLKVYSVAMVWSVKF